MKKLLLLALLIVAPILSGKVIKSEIVGDDRGIITMHDYRGNIFVFDIADIVLLRNGENTSNPNMIFLKYGAKIAFDKSKVFNELKIKFHNSKVKRND